MADLKEFRDHTRRLFIKPDTDVEKMVHAVLGVSGESGELVDAVKKHWIYGKPLDHENILEESGDMLFYVDRILDLCGYTIEDAIQHNFEKLRIRYPDGYTDQAAVTRADKAEQVRATQCADLASRDIVLTDEQAASIEQMLAKPPEPVGASDQTARSHL